jgi:hypothetical protein
MITLRFIRGHGVGSGLISWFGGGLYSHVDYAMPDGTWLGARSDRVGGKPAGVQIRPADYVTPIRQLTLALNTTPEQGRDHYAFLFSQIGKPYDKMAILGFIVGRNWEDPGAWICSELQCAAAISADILKPLCLTANRITPNDLTLLWSALGAN